MEKTIAKMKIGERLVFGGYSSGIDSRGVPVVWQKASKGCDFIATEVLDYLCFDARESGSFRNGSANYFLSNILQYLNSEDAVWYESQHSDDAPPQYHNHVGFLYYFEDYELASLVKREGSLIRLPSAADIVDDKTKFSLFKQKGVRTKPSYDCSRHHFVNEGAYASYWLRPDFKEEEINPYTGVPFISRNSGIDYAYPVRKTGVRPVCTIDPWLMIKNVEGHNDMFRIVPFETKDNNACTDDELMDFLGLKIVS